MRELDLPSVDAAARGQVVEVAHAGLLWVLSRDTFAVRLGQTDLFASGDRRDLLPMGSFLGIPIDTAREAVHPHLSPQQAARHVAASPLVAPRADDVVLVDVTRVLAAVMVETDVMDLAGAFGFRAEEPGLVPGSADMRLSFVGIADSP